MIRRLLALVPVLVAVGCGGGSHEGRAGASPHQPPLSAPSSGSRQAPRPAPASSMAFR